MERPTKKTSKRRKEPTRRKNTRAKKHVEKKLSINSRKCEYCGDVVALSFQCNFCGGQFCAEHRLPENHSCDSLPARTPLGQWKAKIEHPLPKPVRVPAMKEYENPFEQEEEKYESKVKDRSQSSKPLTTALIATSAIAILIIGAFVIPILALTTENPAVVILGILGIFFLFFWILASGMSKSEKAD
jgi:hypothetical protein